MTFYRGILFLCGFLLISPCLLFAQKENNIWYFGKHAGLNFDTNPPTVITNNTMDTREGCSTVSDSSGNLLFYTDGVTVWNKNHAVMKNGDSLIGNSSSTQSSVLVKQPGHDSIYYIFTADCVEIPVNGVHYSVVNINKNGGLGEVIEKNTKLLNMPATEKIVAVKQLNSCSFWIVTHPVNSNSFYAFELSTSGINSTAVVSTTPVTYTAKEKAGYLKASPDGNLLAACSYESHRLEIYTFDAAAGKVTDGFVADSTPGNSYYGCSFSPSGKVLYASSFGSMILYQFNVSNLSPSSIQSSQTVIFKGSTSGNLGGIQVGPDKKLYVTHEKGGGNQYLGTISNPDVLGKNCNYNDSGLLISSSNNVQVRLGLPNFIDAPAPFKYDLDLGGDTFYCKNSFVKLQPNNAIGGNYKWSTGETTASINVNKPGLYSLEVTTVCGIGSDTISVSESQFEYSLSLGNDTVICDNSFTLKIKPPLDTAFGKLVKYLWSNESSSSSININKTGKYWIMSISPCGTISDTINVILLGNKPDPIWLGNDTTICADSFPISVSPSPEMKYMWSTGDTATSIKATQTGQYWIKGENPCYEVSDTIHIELVNDDNVSVYLGPDTLICSNSVVLDAGIIPKAKYLWNTGDTTHSITTDTTGKYFVQVTTYNCNNTFSDTANVLFFTTTPLVFPNDTDICSHRFKGFDLTPKGIYNNYLWSTGSTDSFFVAQSAGYYSLQVSDTCGNHYADDINITVTDCHCELYVPNSFTPNGDGKNEQFFVREYCGLSSFHLWIFDRWGEIVFETEDITEAWDGNYKGKPLPDGVFGVYIHYTFAKLPSLPDYKGNVTLIR